MKSPVGSCTIGTPMCASFVLDKSILLVAELVDVAVHAGRGLFGFESRQRIQLYSIGVVVNPELADGAGLKPASLEGSSPSFPTT